VPQDTPDPLYYLRNFERALQWLAQRYGDLLGDAERAFVHGFASLPEASRALLVRMLMRKGVLFRASRLSYVEIGGAEAAAAPLVEAGWLEADVPVSVDELFALCTRAELLTCFSAQLAGLKAARKDAWLEPLRAQCGDARPYSGWHTQAADQVLHVAVAPLCERLRLMFFGNLQQDWSEFVLADLGVHRYEQVAFAPSSRAFQQREDVDLYLALHACGAALEQLAAEDPLQSLEPLLAVLDTLDIGNAWLAARREKLLYRIGYHAERHQQWDAALSVYQRCAWPGARHRRVRTLERAGHDDAALVLALEAAAAPESEEESQRIARMLPRLRRRVGGVLTRDASGIVTAAGRGSGAGSRPALAPSPAPASAPAPALVVATALERGMLMLARPALPSAVSYTVEYAVRDHLDSPDTPVHYVENALINSLFGLLCWEPVFAALPGAFFHPFQRGPADLHAPDFHARRAPLFAQCLAQLDDGTYQATILRHFDSKAGVQSPFVFWPMLTRELLDLALACIPAAHLKLWFERLLRDVRGNRSGLPDLIRFWPREQRYELIEVKGPGDRLQDNQIRWLTYCAQHGMPVRVLDVRWLDDGAGQGDGGAGDIAANAANAANASAANEIHRALTDAQEAGA
jgi:hypothetical protein